MGETSFDIFGDMQSLQQKIYSIPKQNNKVELDTEIDEQYFESTFSGAFKSRQKNTLKMFVKEKKENKKKAKRKGKEETSAISGSPRQLPQLDKPPLSPLSQLLHDEEQQSLRDAEKGPVSRRLRSSKGSRNKEVPEEVVEESIMFNDESSKVKQSGKGRQKRTGGTQSNQNSEATAEPENCLLNFIESTSGNRNRRRYLAEMAARATRVDCIDLVSAVQPRFEGFISLVDDEPAGNADNAPSSASDILDSSFEADNPEISVKIRWNGNCEKYTLRKYQKFLHIMEQIAERENVLISDIVFNLNDNFVKAHDTPDSIGYKAYHFIDGRAMKFRSPENNSKTQSKLATNIKASQGKQFQLKVQTNITKRPLVFDMKKSDKFKILYIKCAEEFNVPQAQIKLSFDGEALDYDETPETLELDGGEIIDLRIKQ